MQSTRSTAREYFTRNNHEESAEQRDQNPTPHKRSSLRCKRTKPTELHSDHMEAAMQPLTDEERQSWPGWVELESEPALFNFILREFGVEDIRVQEVIDFDMLSQLPRPVYGMIFLFRCWDEEEVEIEDLPKCPNHVWFANQTVTNACATIALLNIVMNIPELHIGEGLGAFKAETKGLKPPYRGQALGKKQFIRNVHNSFARRMDILNADLALSNEANKWARSRNFKKRKSSTRKNQANTRKKDEEEPGFHFIAYVPIDGIVWRLDGMQRQPLNLGKAGENWEIVARDNINLRIAQYDSELEFNVMSLCRSPLRTIPEKLAQNLLSIAAIERALSAIITDWRAFTETGENCAPLPHEPNEFFALSKDLIVNSQVPDSVQRILNAAATDPTDLINMRGELLSEQTRLQKSYMEEVAQVKEENEQAARRKTDHTPVIYNTIKELTENGILKEIVRELVDEGQMQP